MNIPTMRFVNILITVMSYGPYDTIFISLPFLENLNLKFSNNSNVKYVLKFYKLS